MTFDEARKILQDMKHAKELTMVTSMYGGEAQKKQKKLVEALDFVFELMNKIDYKIETLEEEAKRFSGRKARGDGKPITTLIRMSEIDYAISVLKWLDLEGWTNSEQM